MTDLAWCDPQDIRKGDVIRQLPNVPGHAVLAIEVSDRGHFTFVLDHPYQKGYKAYYRRGSKVYVERFAA